MNPHFTAQEPEVWGRLNNSFDTTWSVKVAGQRPGAQIWQSPDPEQYFLSPPAGLGEAGGCILQGTAKW